MKTNSQVSIEFTLLFGAVLVFCLGFLLAINSGMADKIKERKNLELKEIALTVQNEINLALESVDGYQRDFNIPKKFDNKDYSISLQEGLVYVKSGDEKMAIALPIANVTGMIIKGTNSIRKQNNTIYLN